MISVIIPVHNVEKYLERCVDSVLSNTYKDLEIVLVENCSADGSLAICREYEQRYENIKLIVADEPGVSHARNLGLEYAGGEYIAFVDADDYVSPYMYKSLLDTAVQQNCDLVYSAVLLGEEMKHNFSCAISSDVSIISPSRFLYLMYLYSAPAYLSVDNKLYRRDCVETIRFNETLKNGEDLLFNTQAACNCRTIGYVPHGLYYYFRGNETSVCASNIDYEFRVQYVLAHQRAMQYIADINGPKEYLEYIGAAMLRSADFRLRKTRADGGLPQAEEELPPIIKNALNIVWKAKHLPLLEKTKFLVEHYCPGVFMLGYRVKKWFGKR